MSVAPKQNNIIRATALVCVAVTSLFIMYMSYLLVDILAAPEWCGRAINAEKLADSRTTSSVELCKELLLKQVGSLATNSHIYAGTIALCLLVLIVIVIAGGKLNFTVSKTGASGSMGRDQVDPVAAADQVADAAAAEAEVIAGEQR